MWIRISSITSKWNSLSNYFSIPKCIPTHPSYSTATPSLMASNFLKSQSETNSIVHLKDRAILQIEGMDAEKFLNGLMTNSWAHQSGERTGFYTAFLNPQGRVLTDAFLYASKYSSSQNSFFLELDPRSLPILTNHLKRYILRNKVQITDKSSSHQVWSLWGPFLDDNDLIKMTLKNLFNASNGREITSLKDKRGSSPSIRVITDIAPSLSGISFRQSSYEEYTLRRIFQGIPEGPIDHLPSISLPLESNLDYLGAIDFHKGCYVGQELTIRTHHTGVVRKRILPIQFYKSQDNPPNEMEYDPNLKIPFSTPQIAIKNMNQQRAFGKLCSTKNNIGLALLRLESLIPQNQPLEISDDNNHTWFIKPFLPQWWPLKDETSINEKETKEKNA